jgi:hypothetical protein
MPIPGGGFGTMEILVLADLYNTLGDYGSAILTIRRGCRWLQGRAEQKYWDMCDDDREYDLIRDETEREGEVQPGVFPLDVNTRHRLAIARIKMGEIEEGKVCAASLEILFDSFHPRLMADSRQHRPFARCSRLRTVVRRDRRRLL